MLTLSFDTTPQVLSARLLKAARRPRFALENLRYHVGLRPSRQAHIFVLGPPRSGTTLVMRLLGSHSAVTGIDAETFFFLRWNLADYDKLPIGAPDGWADGARTSIEIFDRMAALQKDLTGARYFLEKTPTHSLRFGFLRKHFPNARFVFVVRDGRDAFLSAQRNPRMQVRDLEGYARLWKRCVAARLRQREATNILDLKYEELCANPLSTLAATMEFLGESVEADQLAPPVYGNTAMRQNPGHKRLADEISPQTVGQWRSRLTAAEIRRFTEIAGPELQSQGYEI